MLEASTNSTLGFNSKCLGMEVYAASAYWLNQLESVIAKICQEGVLMSYREMYFPEKGCRNMGQILQKMSTLGFR